MAPRQPMRGWSLHEYKPRGSFAYSVKRNEAAHTHTQILAYRVATALWTYLPLCQKACTVCNNQHAM